MTPPPLLRKSATRLLLRWGLGLALLAVLSFRIDWTGLSLTPRLLLGFGAAVALFGTAQLLAAWRWRVLLGSQAPVWAYLARLYLIGQFFSLFLPTAIGGDAVRAATVARVFPRAGDAVSSVLFDRLLGVAALLVYLGVGLLVAPQVLGALRHHIAWRGSLPLLVGGGILVVGGGLFMSRFKRVRVFLAEARAYAARVAGDAARLWKAAGVSLLVQGTYIVVWIVLGAAMKLGVPASVYLVCVPVVSLAAMLPITISGLGVREGAWVLMMAPLGVAPANVVAFSLLYFVAVATVGAIGGLVYVVNGLDGRPAAALGDSLT